jgi:flagellar basal body-associated protein FliL
LVLHGENGAGRQPHPKGGSNRMSILWIILIVVLVLALLGFFSRGRW